MLQLLIRWSFISRAPGGSPAKNHWFTLISSMPMRCEGSATSTRVSRSRPSRETATSCRAAREQCCQAKRLCTVAGTSVSIRKARPPLGAATSCRSSASILQTWISVVDPGLGLLPPRITSVKTWQRPLPASRHSMLRCSQHSNPARAWKVCLPKGEAQYAITGHTARRRCVCPLASMQCCCPASRRGSAQPSHCHFLTW